MTILSRVRINVGVSYVHVLFGDLVLVFHIRRSEHPGVDSSLDLLVFLDQKVQGGFNKNMLFEFGEQIRSQSEVGMHEI